MDRVGGGGIVAGGFHDGEVDPLDRGQVLQPRSDPPEALVFLTERLVETLRAANGPPQVQEGLQNQVRLLKDGEILKGSGQSSLNLINESGVLAPGFSPGVSNFSNFTQGVDGVLEVEINGWNATNAPVVYDQVIASGNASLNGKLTILLSGFTPVVGQTFSIVKWGGVRVGEFSKYFGTTIPGNNQLALVPEYDDLAKEVRLRVVNTQFVVPQVENALNDVANLVQNLLNVSLPGEKELGLIGRPIDDLINAKNAIQNTIANEIGSFVNSLPTQAQVTQKFEELDGETFGNFQVLVDSVLGHYSKPGDPIVFYSWDLKIIIKEVELTALLADGLNEVFDIVFGPGSKLTLENTVELDLTIGYDSAPGIPSPFVDFRSVTLRTKAIAEGLDPLQLIPPWLVGNPLVNVGMTGDVIFEAFLTFQVDPNLPANPALTSPGPGHWLAVNPPTLPTFDKFVTVKGSSLDATLVLNASLNDPVNLWAPFTFAKYEGVHTLRIVDPDLFDSVDPDLTLIIDGKLKVLNQELKGVFTLSKAGASTDIAIDADVSKLDLNIFMGGGQPIRILKATGQGNFLLKGNGDMAGEMALTIAPGNGPDLPNIDNLSGTFKLTFNKANTPISVPLPGNQSVLIPGGGPYYRIDGTNVALDLGIPDLVLRASKFTFEPNDATPANLADNERDVVVAVEGLSFDFVLPGNNKLVSVTNGAGVLLMTKVAGESGMVAQITSANVAVDIVGLAGLTGQFSVGLNDFNVPFSRQVKVLGTTKNLNLPKGKFLRVEATNAALSLLAGQMGDALTLSGNFAFERQEDPDLGKFVTIAFSNVSLPFLDGVDQQVLVLDQISGIFVSTDQGIAGEASVGNFTFGAPGVFSFTTNPNSVIGLQINTTTQAVNRTVMLGGQSVNLNVDIGPFIRFRMLRVNLTVADFDVITGDFGVERRQAVSGQEMLTVAARNVDFNLGPVEPFFDIRDGNGLFVINNGQFAGAAEVVVDVISIPFLVLDDGDPAPGIKLSFNFNNNALNAINQVFDFSGASFSGAPPAPPSPSFAPAREGAGRFALADDPPLPVPIPMGQVPLSIPAGDFFEVKGPLSIGFNAGGGAQKLSGVFTFTNVDANGQKFLGVKAEDLRLQIKAGTKEVISFREGAGQFAINQVGFGGKASLKFESGMIEVGGDIALEVNTTGGLFQATEGGYNIVLATPNYLKITVNGFIAVGPGAFNFNFTITVDFAANTVIFSEVGALPANFLVKVESDGDIILGPGLPDLPDFSSLGEGDLLPMVKQFINWLDQFRNSSVFDLQIPFTGGKNLGDVLDYANWFIANVYPKVASVELRPVAAYTDASGAPLPLAQLPLAGSYPAFSFSLQVGKYAAGSNEPVVIAMPAGAFANTAQLASNLHAKVSAATGGKVVARVNKNGQPVFALSDGEMQKHSTLVLTFTGANHPLQKMGFRTNQNAVEVERGAIGDMIQAIGGALLGVSPPPLDPNSKMVSFNATINKTLPLFNLPFKFGENLGLIAEASLNGSLSASAQLGLNLTVGFDFSAVEVPMILSSPLVPIPSNGRLSADAHFSVFLNGDTIGIPITLASADTAAFTRMEHLVNYVNQKFGEKNYLGQPLNKWIIARKAAQSIVFMALQEDLDGDGHFDKLNEDDNNNGKLDAGEDDDGDGRLDLNEDANNNKILDVGEDKDGDGILDSGEDLNGDGSFQNRLGVINLLVLVSLANDPAATEMGIGTDRINLGGFEFLGSAAKSSLKGLFIDNAEFSATLDINGPATGKVRIGFLDVDIKPGSGFQTSPDIGLSLKIKNGANGQTRFYIPELMNGLSSLDNLVADLEITGGFSAQLKLGIDPALGLILPSDANIGILVPDIKNLAYNPEPYAPGKTGLFLTYTGLNGVQNFSDIGFLQILQALRAIVSTLSEFEEFGFLSQEIPFIEISLADMLKWAEKIADVVDGVASGNPKSLQKMVGIFQQKIEELFHINGRNQNIFKILVEDTPSPVPTVVSGNVEALFNPAGERNGLKFKANGTGLANARIQIVGSTEASGGQALADWNAATKVLTIKIDSGATTADVILTKVNALGSPWTVSLTEGLGTGFVHRTAIKVHLNFTTGFGKTIPLQVNLQKLVSKIAGDNSPAAEILSQVTSFIHIEGDGLLTVGAYAGVVVDFGLDITNPKGIKPFIYDTTKASLKLEVLGTGLEFEASLGSVVGIFVRDGSVTLDADGDPDTEGKAELSIGFKDNNGDNRHYFNEDLFDPESFGITARAGLTADLPIFAPLESKPLGSDADADGNGYPDNHLVVDIPDLVRLFFPDQANNPTATVQVRGNHNDFIVSTSDLAKDKFKVALIHNPAVAPKANYDAGSNTLNLTLNSGVTTAQQMITAINSQAPTFTAVATADDDGQAATTTNNSTGKLAKTTISTPDFSQLFNNLDLCAILDASAGLFLDGLDSALKFIQDGLNDAVGDLDLPLIGDGLAGTANFIQDFREGLLADLRNAIAQNGGSAIETIKSALKQVIWNILGKPGADLLVDPATGVPLETFQQIDIELDCDNGLEVNLRLHKALFSLDTGDALNIDVGVPGFGLELDGSLQLQLAFDFKFGFGLNKKDGFYFVTSGTPSLPSVNINDVNSSAKSTGAELFLGFSITPKIAGSAQLFFLQLDVKDLGSFFRGGFEIDLKDPNNDGKLTWAELSSPGLDFGKVFVPKLGAEANVDLQAALSFGGNANFPRVLANFHLDWSWDLNEGQQGPNVSIDEIYLDLGSYISDFLGPVLGKIREFVQPADPILEMVTTPLPIISDLLGKPITFLDLAEAFGYLDPGTRKFIEVIKQVVDIIQLVGNYDGKSLLIPMGAFEMIADIGGGKPKVNPAGELFGNFQQDLESIQNANPGVGGTETSDTIGFMGKLDASVFHFPIWDNPAEIFGLFTGEAVRLIEVRLPTFKFEFTYVQKIPIYGPLYARFGGTVGAELTFGFGYDTFGIQKFISSAEKNVLDIFDGFYIIDFDEAGNERPEIRLYGEIFAGASINLGVAEAGVEGGVRVTVDFDLNDFNDDGRIRISELIALAEIDPLCLFNIHGKVDLFLRAFLRVDLLLFSIEAEWEFLTVTLFEFEFTCQLPVPASKSGSTLTLHIGDDADKRLALDTKDGAERFIVKHIADEAEGETVEVNWEGFVEEFKGIKKIYVKNAGEKNDYIDLRGTTSSVDIRLGEGSDTLLLGSGGGFVDGGTGNDTITGGGTGLEIRGGAGADTILVYGKARVYGDDGADKITGSDDDDTLDGGEGADTILSGAGNDVIEGGGGNDYIDAGLGNDIVKGGDGADEILAGDGDDVVRGGGGDDLILGGSGHDVLIGDNGNDQLFGHSGIDLLVGSTVKSWTPNWVSNTAQILASGVNLEDIGYQDDPVQSDDDFIIGGGNYDFLFGGRGDDFLFGGNFFVSGQSEVIEEDDNDFADGGTGNDQLFGDDAQGKTGDRDTGIAVRSVVWLDMNGNSIRDEGEQGVAGIMVQIFSQSDPSFADKTTTKEDGSFKFTGLDPDKYWLKFTTPYNTVTGKGLKLVTPNATGNENADSDAVPINAANPHIGLTPTFQLHVNQTLSTMSAGVIGEVVLAIAESSVDEGASATGAMPFSLSLSRAVQSSVSVRFRTFDATAKSTGVHKDFVAVDQIITFEPGERNKTVSVPILGDTMYEGRFEQFSVMLSQISFPNQDPVFFQNGGQASFTVIGTIVGDDAPPELSISDYVAEDKANKPAVENTPATFVVRLSNPSHDVVTVNWQTVDAAAFEASGQDHYASTGLDYLPGGGVLVFLPGEVEKSLKVTLLQDSVDEYEERFFVELYNAQKALLADKHGVGVIADDDGPVRAFLALDPIYQVDGLPNKTRVFEGGAAIFEVRLLNPSEKDVYVTYASNQGTAVSALPSLTMLLTQERPDFIFAPDPSALPKDQKLHFKPGETVKHLLVETLNQDLHPEGVETFFINLTAAENAVITRNHGIIEVVDNDSGLEGNHPISFAKTNFYVHEYEDFAEITLIKSAGVGAATAVFNTQDITATHLEDYEGGTYIVSFAPHEFVKTVAIRVGNFDDHKWEGTEKVALSMRGFTGKPASAAPFKATLHILDNENKPGVYLVESEVEVTEGNNVKVVFHLRSTDNLTDIKVFYKTVDLTAFDGLDYTGSTGSVVLFPEIDANYSYGQIEILVKNDVALEAPENFGLWLTGVEHAELLQTKGIATIRDDEQDEVKGYVFLDANGNGFFDFNERGLEGVIVAISDGDNNLFEFAETDHDGLYIAHASQGKLVIQVIESTLTIKDPSQTEKKFYSGFILTTDNDSQTINFLGGSGLELFEPVGYKTKGLRLGRVDNPEPVGRGGTDDTLFGGPGNDHIDAGAGDDHVVGGHWQTATNHWSPINQGVYDAKIRALDPLNPPPGQQYEWLRPLNGLIFDVKTAGMGNNATVSGQVWLKDGALPLIPYGGMNINLLDDKGNIVDTVKSSVAINGNYAFNGVFPGKYQLEFGLPPGYSTASAIDPDDFRSAVFDLNDTPANPDFSLNVTIEKGPQVPASDVVVFHKPVYSVGQADEDSLAVIKLVRGEATRREAVVLWTEELVGPNAAKENEHYKPIRRVVNFEIGQFERTLSIKILAAGEIEECKSVVLRLNLYTAPGEKLAQAPLYIKDVAGAIEDNDTIQAGDDWDLILGDSGYIPRHLHPGRFLQPAPDDPAPPPVLNPYNELIFSGGPGDDSIDGGRNIDRIFGQGGEDFITGGYGLDIIDAGLGNDFIAVSWGDDIIEGSFDRDILEGTRDAHHSVQRGAGPGGADLLHFDLPGINLDTTITFKGIEHLKLVGGVASNLFTLTNWSGSAEIFGFFGDDRILVDHNTDMKLKDGVGESLTLLSPVAKFILPEISTADASEDGPTKSLILANETSAPLSDMIGVSPAKTGLGFQQIGKYLNGHDRSSLTLGNGSLYVITGVESAHLVGGASDNVLDASGYSGDVTFQGKGGNDEMIGGKGDDVFVFTNADTGVDTVTGNGDGASAASDKGFDTLDFTALSHNLTVDVHILNVAREVWLGGPLSLIFGDEDIDALLGGSGDDLLIGNARDNVLLGGLGNDRLEGREGSETYRFDADLPWGVETIVENLGDPGRDVLDFSLTSGVAVNVDLNSLAPQPVGGLTLVLGAGGFEEIRGGDKNDTLKGNSESNTFYGGPGDDTLIGREGDDIFHPGAGFDTIGGGEGVDLLIESGNVHFVLNNANLFKSNGEIESLNSVEAAELKGGEGSNTFNLTGWSGSAKITGVGLGADQFLMQAAGDFKLLNLGASDVRVELDRAAVDGVADQAFELLGIERVELTGGATDDLMDASALSLNPQSQPRIMVTLKGGAGNDTLIGSPWADTLKGGEGDDVLSGGTGDDVLDGGAGTGDKIDIVKDAKLFVLVNNAIVIDDDPLTPESEFDQVAQVELIKVTGGPGDNVFDVTGWTNGPITIDGAGQIFGDTVKLEGDHDFTITDAGILLAGGAGQVVFTGIERALLTGGDGDNVLDARGYSGQAVLFGMNGNDVLYAGTGIHALAGGDGADTLVSGPGNSILHGGDGDDLYVFDADSALGLDVLADSGGTDTLDFGSTTTLGIALNLASNALQVVNAHLQLQLPGPAWVENVKGSQNNDSLTGNDLDNVLEGNKGVDTLNGGLGKDRLEGGDEADVLDGGGGDDFLVGAGGNDQLNGGLGNDIFEFDADDNLGSDFLADDGGLDTITFAKTESRSVTLNLGVFVPQPVTPNFTLQIIGPFIESVVGGAMADTLTGNNLNNFIMGGGGSDLLDGGLGIDIVRETRDADFVLTNTQLKIGSEVDTLVGFEQALLTGGSSNNTLDASGFAGRVVLSGLGGVDTLIGGSSNDILIGGDDADYLEGRGGFDILLGGKGNDFYLFNLSNMLGIDSILEADGEGVDTLVGFNPGQVNLANNGVQVISPNLSLVLSNLNVELLLLSLTP